MLVSKVDPFIGSTFSFVTVESQSHFDDWPFLVDQKKRRSFKK